MTTPLKNSPISGEYEEIIFDLQEIWREHKWHFVLFTTSQGEEWCGHFRAKEGDNFLIAELTNKNIACIVSGGHGYIINIDKKELIKDLEEEPIISLSADNLSSSFIITTYWSLVIVNKDFEEIEIKLPISADGIYLKESKDRKINLEIDEIGASMKMNINYYLDLEEMIVKKHWA